MVFVVVTQDGFQTEWMWRQQYHGAAELSSSHGACKYLGGSRGGKGQGCLVGFRYDHLGSKVTACLICVVFVELLRNEEKWRKCLDTCYSKQEPGWAEDLWSAVIGH